MKLHEYQSKFRFAEFGIPIPEGKVADSPDEAFQIAKELGGTVVVKAQVLVGGRGKAGGIKLARDPDEAEELANQILGMEIKGLVVDKVLVDQAADIKEEIYLGIVIDRARQQPVIIASAEGGVEIEEVAKTNPEAIIRRPGIDSDVGAISAGTLEMSNVDIAQEFTNMIVAQRGFQANARTITTSDEMLVELVNLKR